MYLTMKILKTFIKSQNLPIQGKSIPLLFNILPFAWCDFNAQTWGELNSRLKCPFKIKLTQLN